MFFHADLQAEPVIGSPDELWAALANWIPAEQAREGRPLVVGLCGPQGSGKTTGAEAMRLRLEGVGLHCAVLALDDLYLSKAERARLAAEVHPLFATRGPPGTHDVARGLELLDALVRPGAIDLPRFDKSTDDRARTGTQFDGPADVVIFEGWSVGAAPEPEARLADPVNCLEAQQDPTGEWRRYANAALAGPYVALFGKLDRLIQHREPDFEVVTGWRMQQEHALRAQTGGGMSDDEVRRFVQHYERLTRWIEQEMPGRADVVVSLNPDRSVERLEFKAP